MDHDSQLLAVPFTRADLPGLGLTDSGLRRALSEARVRRVLRGVYVPSEAPDTVELRAHALAKVLGDRQICCDRTAAWLHGVSVLDFAERSVLPPVESCVLRGDDPTELRGVRSRSRDLRPDDIVTVHGLRATSPLRTALDLGCILRRRDALASLDQFRRLHELTVDQLVRESIRYRGRRGVVQLRQLIPISDPRAESVRESWTRLAILDAGLPNPVPQFWVEADGALIFRLDLAYPRHRVAVEYDGAEFHGSTEQIRHDEDRRAWLAEHGWSVVVVRVGDFSGKQLDRWLGELGRALSSRSSNLRW
jgi:hypothetical protein